MQAISDTFTANLREISSDPEKLLFSEISEAWYNHLIVNILKVTSGFV